MLPRRLEIVLLEHYEGSVVKHYRTSVGISQLHQIVGNGTPSKIYLYHLEKLIAQFAKMVAYKKEEDGTLKPSETSGELYALPSGS